MKNGCRDSEVRLYQYRELSSAKSRLGVLVIEQRSIIPTEPSSTPGMDICCYVGEK